MGMATLTDASGILVADFFCGCGGTSAGLQAAGMEIRLGLDFEPEASATYQRNFPDATFLESDVREVDVTEIEDGIGERNGPLLLSACAPCQPFSSLVANKAGSGHARRDGRRSLLLRLLPIVERLEPDYVLIENVPGLKAASPASTFNRFSKALRGYGYHVASGVVDCRVYGVPQRRRRLLILASRRGPLSLPEPTHGLGAGTKPFSTVHEWISDLPPIEAGETHPTVDNHQASALSELNLRRIRATPEGGNRNDWPRELELECHRTHSGHSDVYGRLRWDGTAPVLTTKCTSLSNGRFGHPEQDRPISVREAACLQTFPRDFVFTGGITSATRQIGNAVPVLLAEAAGRAIIDHQARASESGEDPATARQIEASS